MQPPAMLERGRRRPALTAAVLLACAAGTAAAQPYTIVQWTGYQTTCGDPLPPIAAFTDPDCWADGVGPLPQEFPFAQLVVLGGNDTPEGAANEIYLGGLCAEVGAICPPIAQSDPLDFHVGSLMVASGDFLIDGGTGVYGDVAGCDTSGRGTITTDHFVLSAVAGQLPFDPERGTGPSSLTLRDTDATVWGTAFVMGSQTWGPTHVVLDRSSLNWGVSPQARAIAILHDGSTLEARNGSRISFEHPQGFGGSSLAGLGDGTLKLDDSEFVGDFYSRGGVNLEARNGSRVLLTFAPFSPARLSGQSISIESGSSVEARDAWLPEDGTLLVENSTMSFTNDFRTEGTSNVINSTISAGSMGLGGLFTADAATTLNTGDLDVDVPVILEGAVLATGMVRIYADDVRIDRLHADDGLDVRGDHVTISAERVGGNAVIQGDSVALVESSIEGDALVTGDSASFSQVSIASDLEVNGESFLLEGSRVDGTLRQSGSGIRLRNCALSNWEPSADVEELSNVELAGDLLFRSSLSLNSGEGFSTAGDVSVMTGESPVVSVTSHVPWTVDGDLVIRGSLPANRASVTIESSELSVEGETALAATSLSARGTLSVIESTMRVGGNITVYGGGASNASLLVIQSGSIEPTASAKRFGEWLPTLRLGNDSIRRYGRLALRSSTIGIPVVLDEVGSINGTGTLHSLESAGEVELSSGRGPIEVEHAYTEFPGARIEARGDFTGVSASTVTLAGALEITAPGDFGVYLLVESRDEDIQGTWSEIDLPAMIGDRRSTLRRTPRRIELVVHCAADLTSQGAEPGSALYGQPDSVVTVEDLTFFVEAWINGDATIADTTTSGSTPGGAGYGEPDGEVGVQDLTYFVEAWLAGCG